MSGRVSMAAPAAAAWTAMPPHPTLPALQPASERVLEAKLKRSDAKMTDQEQQQFLAKW